MASYTPWRFNLTKFLRLFRIALLTLLVTYLAINAGLGWVYVYILTHPACPVAPRPGLDLPPPDEYLLETSDGLQLRAWYYPSANGAAVLALGGLQGALGGSLPPAGFLVDQGYGVLQLDSRMCAEPPRAVTLGYAEVRDAKAGLAFLLDRPEVDPERVGVFGFSMGGVTAIRAAAQNPQIAAIVAEGGYDNLGRDILEPGRPKSILHQILLYFIAGSYWIQIGENPWLLSPIDDLPAISPRPVLLIYGEHELNSGQGDRQYAAAGDPKELWIVPAGDHGRNHLVASEAYVTKILSFFDKYLK